MRARHAARLAAPGLAGLLAGTFLAFATAGGEDGDTAVPAAGAGPLPSRATAGTGRGACATGEPGGARGSAVAAETAWTAATWEVLRWIPAPRLPRPEDYRPVKAGSGSFRLRDAGDLGRDAWVVLIDDRERPRQSVPVEQLRNAPIRTAVPGSTIRVRILPVQAGGHVIRGAMLAASSGAPLGSIPLDGDLCLPRPFHGFVLAKGYLTTPIRVNPASGAIRVEMRPAARATGRLVGGFTPGRSLLCRSLVDPSGSCETVQVGGEGRFAIGPLPAGPVVLTIGGRRAQTPGDEVRFVLVEGQQDLGLVHVPPRGDVIVEVAGTSEGVESCFASAYFSDLQGGREEAENIEYSVRELEKLGGRRWLMRKVPPGRIAGHLWTTSGEFGEIPEFVVPAGRPATAVLCVLRPPGHMRVTVGGGARVLRGWRVVAVDESYGLSIPQALRRARFHVHARLRAAPVPASRVVELEELWARRYRVALVTEHGVVVGEAEVDIAPGAFVAHWLEWDDRLATVVVECEGDPGRRPFALRKDDLRDLIRGTVRAGEARHFRLGRPK